MDGKEPLPTLLIVGSETAGRSEFVAQLQAASAPSAAITDAGSQQTVTLDNKYYTASLAVLHVSPESAAQHSEDAPPEGIILLFSSQDAVSFSTAREALASSGASAEVQLCVASDVAPAAGDAATSPTESQDACAAAQRWACGEVFEYIEVNTRDAAADAQLVLDGERQGISRVLEALSAHMWPGLRMKPPGVGGGGAAAASAAALDRSRAGSAAADSIDDQLAGSHPDTSEPLPGAADGPTARLNVAAAAPLAVPQPQDAFGAFLGAEDADPDDDEADMKYTQLMGQLAGARQQLQSLPDEQRRAGAEHMALQMMQLLGLDDDSDAGGDGESDATGASGAAAEDSGAASDDPGPDQEALGR